MKSKALLIRSIAALITSVVIMSLFMCSCSDGGEAASQSVPDKSSTVFTDSLGNSVTVKSHDRVVSLYGSFAETWVLAGGSLCGVTEDAIEERNMELSGDVTPVGSVKTPNFEAILALEPDFVILSADIASQVDLSEALTEAGITHAYFRVDTFDGYLSMLELFCSMTGREDLYRANGSDIGEQIEAIKSLVENEPEVTGLLLRTFSTGAKAKGADNLAGVIMEDLGVDNIVSRHESLLDELSIEEIISEDPDFIFISTMGDEDAAISSLESGIMSSPAWDGLSAVKNERCYILPKELFHYKPNARWAESYAYMAKLLYPELSEEIYEILL